MERYWIDWAEWIVWGGSLAIGAGVFKQRQREHTNRINQIERTLEELHDDHRKIELTVASIPTKDDFAKLSESIQALQLAMVRVETILNGLKKKDE